MTEKEEKYGEDRSRSERVRTLFLRLFGCTKKNNHQEISQKEKEGERSSISFCKEDSFAPTDTMTNGSTTGGSVPSLPPPGVLRPSARPRLMRQSSRSESCLQNVWCRGHGAPVPAPGSSLPPHMRKLGGSAASLRRERGVRTRSFEAFRSGSLTRSSLKVREESDALANIKKREMVNEMQERKGSQRWKSGQRWKDAQEKERKTKECKEGSPRVRLQRMVRASLR